MRMNSRLFTLAAAALAAAILSGCSMMGSKPLDRGAYHEHTVRYPGETLSIISAWYTGNVGNWRSLRDADGGREETIRLGDKVYVPKELLQRRKPLPRDFVLGWYPAADSNEQRARAQYPPAEAKRFEELEASPRFRPNRLTASREQQGPVCLTNDQLETYCRGLTNSPEGDAETSERERKKSDLLRQLIAPF